MSDLNNDLQEKYDYLVKMINALVPYLFAREDMIRALDGILDLLVKGEEDGK